MKSRNRELNIFSMSALDLFASAMGAFILIAFVLFPYFPNTGDSAERVAEVRAQLESQLESCEERAKKKFVLVVMSWNTSDDIDLHVIDPNSREFYYGEKSFSGSRAKLEEDNTRGPGNEIWLHPAAEDGTYKVYYKYYNSRGSNNVRVQGSVLTPEGRIPFREKTLRREGEKILVATVTVDAEGNMQVTHQ